MSLYVVITIICFVKFSTVHGCGQVPGQGNSVNFNVSGFTLPSRMVFTTEADVRAKVASISGSMDEARTFILNLIRRTVEEVLEQQGRSALLPYSVISAILEQLTVSINNYTPLRCNHVFTAPPAQGDMFVDNKEENCYIIENTVTSRCLKMMGNNMCMTAEVQQEFMNFSGTLTTTNIIMANWQRSMWQDVMNRALRSLSSGPFSSNFIRSSIMVN